MSKRMKRLLIWGLLPIVVCAAVFGVELLMNRGTLGLPEDQQGDVALALSDCEIKVDPVKLSDYGLKSMAPKEGEPADTEEDWGEEEAEAAEEAPAVEGLDLSSGDNVAVFHYSGFLNELTITGNVASGSPYIVTCYDERGKELPYCESYYLLGIGQDTIHIGRQVSAFTLRFPLGGAVITEATIHNDFVLNPYRMLLVGLIVACGYLLIALRELIGRKAEYGFLTVALACGLFLSICMPTNVNQCFDDQIHFARVQKLSWGKEARCTQSAEDLTAMGWSASNGYSFVHRLDTARDHRVFEAALDAAGQTGDIVNTDTLQWNFSDVGYVTQALGMAAARTLGLPFHVQFIWARVANMLTYVLLCFFAVRALKRFKLVMAAVALMPTPMFLACSYSYDPTINGLCFLGIALVVDAMLDRNTLLTWQRGLGILLCFVLGGLTKVVYLPLLLLVLLLPRSKFASNGQRIWYKSAAVVLCAVAVGVMVLNVLGDTAASIEDVRGEGADSAGQLAFILANPVQYLVYFFTALADHFDLYFLNTTRTTWAYVGSATMFQSWLSLLLILLTCFTDNDPALGQRLNWRLRLAMLLIAGLVIGMVFTTMYVAFSAVGSPGFGGVQGRYLLPVLPLLFMLLSPAGVHNRMNKISWHFCFYAINAAILLSMCWMNVLSARLM